MSNLYKCNICGNLITKVIDGGGELVCCNQPMENIPIKSGEEGTEKHKPVITKTEHGIKVHVGSIDHPMNEEHHIQLIQIRQDGEIIAGKRLKSTDAPEVEFKLDNTEGITALAYCNLHGFWKSD